MKTIGYVYEWTELSTGKLYIGRRTRKGCHPGDGYICSSKIVKPMILKNPDNWSRHVICESEDLDFIKQVEMRWLQLLDAARNPMMYNLSNGDLKFDTTGTKLTTEHRNKIGEASKGRTHSIESRQKMSEANKGKKRSPETLKKMSEANKGKPAHNKGKTHSQESKQKMSDALKGHIHSPETREKMKGRRAHNKGKKHSPETLQKMSEALKGKPAVNKGKTHSPETRQKMSEARKKYLQQKKQTTIALS